MDVISFSKKNIVFIYILHFLLEIIIIAFNIYYYTSKYWINISFKVIFLIGIIIICFFFIFPLIPLYFILFVQNKNNKLYANNGKISLIFLILSILIGVIINIIFWINLSEFSRFYKDCPYNYSIGDFIKLSEKNEKFSSNEICQKRICLDYNSEFINNNIIITNETNNLYSDNYLNYLCSFDSSDDFKNNEVKCGKLTFTSNNNYLTYCSKYIFYYLCQRSSPPSKYKIDFNGQCPLENKKITFIDIFIILNILIGFLPWFLELKYMKGYINSPIQSQENNIENNNQDNPNRLGGQNQINQLLNKTTNTSENIKIPNSGENLIINNNVNENINESLKENKNESKEQTNYIIIVNDYKNNINSEKEDTKENVYLKKKINNESIDEDKEDTKDKFNIIQSPIKINLNNNNNISINESENNINRAIMNEITKQRNSSKGNLFNLRKKVENENNININKKKERFINNNNKTLNFLGSINTNNNILCEQNNNSEYYNKKNTSILKKLEKSYLSCKKEENKDKKLKIINLSKTVKKSRKERNKIMDNVWKILENQNSRTKLKKNK